MNTAHRRSWVRASVVTVLAAVSITGACSATDSAVTGPTEGWHEPVAYSFALDSQCGERSLLGRFEVSVRDGQVAEVAALDPAGARVIRLLGTDVVPTVGSLLEEARAARTDGAHVNIVLDEADGHPISIEIDWGGDDAQACYLIGNYATSP
ncbi:MAG: DUF6174 domain-containing protein [Acidimicrobiia bacterium]